MAHPTKPTLKTSTVSPSNAPPVVHLFDLPTPPLTPHSTSPTSTSPALRTPTADSPSTLDLPSAHDGYLADLPLCATNACGSPSKSRSRSKSVPVPVPVPVPKNARDDGYASSLYNPLKAHLTLLHPSTPSEVIEFCAIRLLSPDRPYGFQGDWVPLYLNEVDEVEDDRDWVGDDFEERLQCEKRRKGGFDLLTAGVGMDASKSLRESGGQNGPGKRADQRLDRMYHAARQSWKLLEMRSPIGSKL